MSNQNRSGFIPNQILWRKKVTMKMRSEGAIVQVRKTRSPSNRIGFSNFLMWGICCWLSCQLATSASAQNLQIYTTGQQYSTHVDASGDLPTISRTTVSSSAFSDSIEMPRTESGPDGPVIITTHADASAGLFDVSSYAGWGLATAIATNQISFVPTANQSQNLSIHIYAPTTSAPSGSLLLLDLSANSTVWNFTWGMWGGGTYLGFYPGGTAASLDFDVATDFLATDEYELTMATSANAADDIANSQVQLTGLVVVPEPTGIHLLVLAGLALPAYLSHRGIRRRVC